MPMAIYCVQAEIFHVHVVAIATPFTVNFSTPTSWSSTRKSMLKHCRMGSVCLMLDLQVRLNEPQGWLHAAVSWKRSALGLACETSLVLYYCVEAYIDIVLDIMHMIKFFLVFSFNVHMQCIEITNWTVGSHLHACVLLTRLYILKSKSSLYIVLKMLEESNQASCISLHLSNGLPRLFAEHSLLSTFSKLTQS